MSIEDVAKAMSPPAPTAVKVSFVNASGCMAIPVKDGGLPCRSFSKGAVLHLDAPDDGLIAEMNSGRAALPWFNKEQRQDAIDQIRDERPDLDETTCADLIAWIEATPWYDS